MNDFEIESEERIHKGFLEFVKVRFRFKKFDGSWSNFVDRELLKRHKAACILLHDPKLEKFVVIEQFRVGCWKRSIEIVAGVVEEGETPDQVVVRESVEEAGLKVSNVQPLCSYYPSAGGSTEKLYIYLGEVDAQNAGGIFGLDAEDEDIKVHVISYDEGREWLASGKIDSGPAIVALQQFFLYIN